VRVVGIAGQATARLDRLLAAGEDRDPVPRLLSMPDRAVADVVQRLGGEFLVDGLQLLQAHDVRGLAAQPLEQMLLAGADAVHVEGRDL